MRRRILALAALVGAALVPAQARAADAFNIDAATFATGSNFCGNATNAFDVPSHRTLRVVGETGRLRASCNVTMHDGAALEIERATLKSNAPENSLTVSGLGTTRLSVKDAAMHLRFVYFNDSASPSQPAGASVDLARDVFDGPGTMVVLCNHGVIRSVESQFFGVDTDSVFVLAIVSDKVDCKNQAFNTKARIEVVGGDFNANGGAVAFLAVDDYDDYSQASPFGTVVVRDTKVAPGDRYIVIPNPSP